MTRHRHILGRPTQNPVRRTPFMKALRRAGVYSISDVRFRYLTQNPLRTLQSYKAEMEIFLEYGNPEAHYTERIKHYFALHNARKGLKHLKISATNHFEQG